MGFGKWFDGFHEKSGEEGGVPKNEEIKGGEEGNNLSEEEKNKRADELGFTRFIRVDSNREPEKNLENKKIMEGAGSLEDLKVIIRHNQIKLKGSRQGFGPDDLCVIIDGIKSGKSRITTATKTDGFREIVRKLAIEGGVKVIEGEQDIEREVSLGEREIIKKEKVYSELIGKANSLNDLIEIIVLNHIQLVGLGKIFDTGDLNRLIGEIERGEKGFKDAPVAGGFMDKVRDLWDKAAYEKHKTRE